MEGVEVRHATNCNKRRKAKSARCNCQPSYRAWVSDKKAGRVVRRPWVKDKSVAMTERSDLVAALASGTLRTEDIPLLDTFAREVFIPGILNGSILSEARMPYKGGTARSYRTALERRILTAPELKDKRLDQITRKDLIRVVERMIADKYAAWSIHNTINPLRALLRYAVHCEILPPDFTNPTKSLSIPKGARRKVVHEATGKKGEMVIRGASEVFRMIDVLPVDQRAMFATAAFAGLRRGELRGLQIRHVDLKLNVIRVSFGWDDCDGQTGLKTDAAERDVPILKALRPYLVAHLATLDSMVADSPFFPGISRRGVIDPDKYMKQIREVWTAHEITWLQLHDARHTFASMMIASGANLKQISRIMGHSSITITLDTYGHLLPGDEREAADKMDAWLERTRRHTLGIAA